MADQPEKKRQHYVPRLILRQFSSDGASISLFVLEPGRQVHGASISTQCYENYFYGNDGKVENGLSNLEGVFSKALGDRSATHLDGLSEVDLVVIRFFVQLQRARTLAAAEQMNEQNDSLMKAVFAKDPRMLELGIDFDTVRIGVDRPQNEALYFAAMTWPILLDLNVKFLVAKGKLGFVVSDHPVVTYNQFAEHHPVFRSHLGTTGLGVKGLQVFLPLSPRLCLAMYDPGTYEYGSPKSRTCSVGLRDVRLLNTLQSLNAQECLYFDAKLTPSDELAALAKEWRKHRGWRKAQFFQSEEVQRPDGSTSQIVGFTTPEVRVGTKFGFLSVTDRGTYEGAPKLPMRSRDLLKLTDAHAEQVRAWRRATQGGG